MSRGDLSDCTRAVALKALHSASCTWTLAAANKQGHVVSAGVLGTQDCQARALEGQPVVGGGDAAAAMASRGQPCSSLQCRHVCRRQPPCEPCRRVLAVHPAHNGVCRDGARCPAPAAPLLVQKR